MRSEAQRAAERRYNASPKGKARQQRWLTFPKQKEETKMPTTRELIARSSLGGAAWCRRCDHPKDNHRTFHNFRALSGCGVPVGDGWCACVGFDAMTPEEWLESEHGRV